MTKGGSLVYEIYALQTYRIQSSRWTFYLRINEISVFGLGYIFSTINYGHIAEE